MRKTLGRSAAVAAGIAGTRCSWRWPGCSMPAACWRMPGRSNGKRRRSVNWSGSGAKPRIGRALGTFSQQSGGPSKRNPKTTCGRFATRNSPSIVMYRRAKASPSLGGWGLGLGVGVVWLAALAGAGAGPAGRAGAGPGAGARAGGRGPGPGARGRGRGRGQGPGAGAGGQEPEARGRGLRAGDGALV